MAGEVPADLDLMTAANHLTRLRWALLAVLLSRLEGFVMEGFCTVGYPSSYIMGPLSMAEVVPFCFSAICQKLVFTQ